MDPRTHDPRLEDRPSDPNAPEGLGPDDEGLGNIRADRPPVPEPTDSETGPTNPFEPTQGADR